MDLGGFGHLRCPSVRLPLPAACIITHAHATVCCTSRRRSSLDHSIERAYTASFAALWTLLLRSWSFFLVSPPFHHIRRNPRKPVLSAFPSSTLTFDWLSELSPAFHHRRHPFPRQNSYNQLPLSFRFYVPLPCIDSDICHHPSQHHEFDIMK